MDVRLGWADQHNMMNVLTGGQLNFTMLCVCNFIYAMFCVYNFIYCHVVYITLYMSSLHMYSFARETI